MCDIRSSRFNFCFVSFIVTGSSVVDLARSWPLLALSVTYFYYISDGFDIVVNDCFAHNGAAKRIQLIDEFGYEKFSNSIHIYLKIVKVEKKIYR